MCVRVCMYLCVCVCVNFQIKTRQVFRQLRQILPRVTGKKAIFVPHLFQTLIPAQICGVRCYCITQSNRFSGQLAAAVGFLQPAHTLDSDWDRESGSGRGQTCKQQHLSFRATACERSELCVGAKVPVLMQQRKGEEFVFTAIYR